MGAAASVPDERKAAAIGMSLLYQMLVAIARRLAIEGTGERTAAHGISIGAAPREQLEFVFGKDEDGDPLFGRIQNPMFDFREQRIALDSDEGWSRLQVCARDDGMIVVTPNEAGTGFELVCGKYFVTDTSKGTGPANAGGRHLATSAFA